MNLELAGARVVITGSSRGIGLGIATAFLAEGAAVLLTGRDAARLAAAAAALGEAEVPGRVTTQAGDLTQPAGVAALAERVRQQWGACDVLVLNLGAGRSLARLEADATEWERVLRLNLVAAMEALRVFEPLLAAGRQPAVVVIGSIAGLEALGAPLAYGAAKAALTHAVQGAARLLAPAGIRVNIVAPGNIFFPGGSWEERVAAQPDQVQAMLAREVPMGRFGTPAEVAAVVAFVASPRASFMSGACVVVDGGQTRAFG